jgi:hypothetical protein
MKEIKIKLYDYEELPKKAQEKALNNWAETVEDPMLQAHLDNLLTEELDERGVKYEASSINCMYSLSYCQGDGLMFEGTLEYKGHSVTIKHSGRYYHSNSKEITWNDFEGESKEAEEEKIAAAFEAMYQEVCKKIERAGYDEIEYQQSEEAFMQACEANEYTFEEDGTMRNA